MNEARVVAEAEPNGSAGGGGSAGAGAAEPAPSPARRRRRRRGRRGGARSGHGSVVALPQGQELSARTALTPGQPAAGPARSRPARGGTPKTAKSESSLSEEAEAPTAVQGTPAPAPSGEQEGAEGGEPGQAEAPRRRRRRGGRGRSKSRATLQASEEKPGGGDRLPGRLPAPPRPGGRRWWPFRTPSSELRWGRLQNPRPSRSPRARPPDRLAERERQGGEGGSAVPSPPALPTRRC